MERERSILRGHSKKITGGGAPRSDQHPWQINSNRPLQGTAKKTEKLLDYKKEPAWPLPHKIDGEATGLRCGARSQRPLPLVSGSVDLSPEYLLVKEASKRNKHCDAQDGVVVAGEADLQVPRGLAVDVGASGHLRAGNAIKAAIEAGGGIAPEKGKIKALQLEGAEMHRRSGAGTLTIVSSVTPHCALMLPPSRRSLRQCIRLA